GAPPCPPQLPREGGPQPLTTPSGVSRFVARTSDADAAMTDSMSLYAKAASSATSFGSEDRSTTPSASISAYTAVDVFAFLAAVRLIGRPAPGWHGREE